MVFGSRSSRRRANAPLQTAHDFAFTGIGGEPLPLADFTGRPVLVVNTASRCGFTTQYDGLQKLWRRYGERGLVVLGVPSNDFGGQEPGSSDEIQSFCATGFGIDFPMTARTRVRGDDAHPFYRWAAGQTSATGRPLWNFHKYLIDPEGRLAASFSAMTPPTAGRLTRAVESALRRSMSV